MNGTYKISVRVWPYQTNNGRDEDQKLVGKEHQSFEIRASDFHDAYKKAKVLVQGIHANPAVWNVPITAIEYKGEV